MTAFTYDQIADILLHKEHRLTADTPLQHRKLFGGRIDLANVFRNTNFSLREPTIYEELKHAGFSHTQIRNFADEWLLAQQEACITHLIRVPGPNLGEWRDGEKMPHIDSFENSLRANLKLLAANHPPAFMPGHPEGNDPVINVPHLVLED